MRRWKPMLLGTLLCAVFFVPALACLWDHDTLQMERQRFPSVLEAIAGSFLRHSTEFYEWRIRDRQAKLAANPQNVKLYDDLAVAYCKTGKPDKAIETILKKNAIKPGLYETYSNLGTFQFFNGQIDESIATISKALAINHDAHFGREKYQKLLFEYMVSVREGETIPLPLRARSGSGGAGHELVISPIGFAAFVVEARKEELNGAKFEQSEELRKALKGVLGMMTFADYEAPVLLEALGDLLLTQFNEEDDDAKQLAARAYLKASYSVQDEGARKAYRSMAESVLSMQMLPGVGSDDNTRKLAIIEVQLRSEVASAKKLFAEIRASEMAWIAAGDDPEAKFFEKYYASARSEAPGDPEAAAIPLPREFSLSRPTIVWALCAFLLVCMAALVGMFVLAARRRQSRRRA